MAHGENANKGGDGAATIEIKLTAHARQSFRLRGISVADVSRALKAGAVSQVDGRTGHLVYKLDGGDVRVVARKEGDALVVMTAFRRAEFAEDAG